MYEEVKIKKRIDWKSLLIKCAILCLIVFIVCAVIITPKNTFASTPLNNESKKMLKAGIKYYDNSKLPTKLGRANKISLNELINNDLLKEKDYSSCDKNNSYVKVTKVNKKEFSIYAYLTCGEDENTVVDSIKTLVDNSKNKDNTIEENVNNIVEDDNFTIEVIE